MSEIVECTRGSVNPVHGFRTLWYKFNVFRSDPTYFEPDGIWVFCGSQGSGKTLSAVQTLATMVKRYPRALVYSNMDLYNIPADIQPFHSYEQLQEVDNGTEGVIFFIDEIHLLWNSLESKEIPFSEMACFCQMRKARRVILGTTQVYGRIAKPIREQLKYVINCKNYLGFLQVNDVCDPTNTIEIEGHIDPEIIRKQIWFHKPELYQMYETLGIIKRIDRKSKELPKWKNSPSSSTSQSWRLPSR